MLSYSIPSYIQNIYEKKIPGFPGICYQCDFCTNGYSDSNTKHLLDESLHESLTHAVAKRKSEFVAGRYLARKALITLGSSKATVGVGANREPIWPDYFLGSLSHTSDFAICAVANKKDVDRIGIDAENILNQKVAKDIVKNILIESEYKLVGTYNNPDPVMLTLIFSAKESLFKALYPEVKHYFDFDTAKMKEINFTTRQFTLELVQMLGPNLPIGTRFYGTFEFSAERVFTVITC
ncbi:4'-phosphopantetheinyl transferase family protein [Colwellia psychrerythraea]|uniref:Enterobactin synthase component D n=1 Tax=Colwellia psychrerythraea TaxID=28229 RepID=A0A099L521_COLPS|nr:4'-phosphopantetheinyl transferase superfamily protein [Colwellia psychrerythraea]KGJ97520.1 4'-phosphopantetheinyl transferase [Colwellia psychrerythraea]